MEILQKEFNIEVTSLHGLEEEIYLTIMKNFLKDWPEWDEFDKNVNTLKTKTNFEKNQVFEKNYRSLKIYLKTTLDAAIPLAKEAVRDVVKKYGSDNTEGDVVLEIQATRDQLNHLFFRHPNSKHKNTIFNISPVEPSKIIVFTPSLQSILNWWDVNITIFPPYCASGTNVCFYRRETKHEFKHVLVNKKIMVRPTKPKQLDQEIQFNGNYKTNLMDINTVVDLIKNLETLYSKSVKNIDELFGFVTRDLLLLTPKVYPLSNYKRYTNKYPYVRYLYQEVENVSPSNQRSYDIQLEETIRPSYQIYIGNIDQMSEHYSWNVPEYPVVVDCMSCSAVFKGCDLISELKSHFETHHQQEVDFKCTNCGKEFAIEALSQNWWCHKC